MAKKLLILERFAMLRENITFERCCNPLVRSLRTELFGESKSHGGLFKEISGKIDDILFRSLKNATLGS